MKQMKTKDENKKRSGKKSGYEKKDNLKGYPLYPATEDIYSQGKEEQNIDPENVSEVKKSRGKYSAGSDKENDSDIIIDLNELDIPGSELDDESENTGNEDEENNYYSLGGDDHNDLEEDKGD
jgi:hypothetical protein